MADFLEKLSSFSNASIGAAMDSVTKPASVPVVPAPAAPAPTAMVPVAPEQKRVQDLGMIDAALANPDAMALLNVSRDRNNDLTRNNEILQDRERLSAPDFILKYGDDVYQKVAALDAGRGHLRELENGTRNGFGVVSDFSRDVQAGIVGSLGGLTTFALSGVNKNAAVASAETTNAIQNYIRGNQTQPLQRRRFVDSLRSELDKQDNQNAFERDKKDGGELLASLRSFGRGIVSGTNRLIEDPTILASGVSEAGGSLLVGGPVSRAVSAGANAVAGRVFANAPGAVAAGGAGARAASEALSKAAFPATIGMMEAGGAYSQTVNEVMEIPHETLMKSSTAYAALRAQGMSERDAKVELASQAGNVASAITFPVAALTGSLVARFEANPLAQVASGRAAAGNIVREFTEEGIQSGVGQAAGNVGQRLTVDPEKNLAEGVGDSAIQGAIFGAGSGGVLQAPGLAARGAREAGRALLAPIAERADRIRAENQAASPVSAENLATEVSQAIQDAPATAQAVRSVVNDPAIAEAQRPVVESIASEIERAFVVTPEETASLHPELQAQASQIFAGGNVNRFDLMALAAASAANAEMPQDVRTDAALWLLDQKSRQDAFIRTGSEVLGQIDHARPEVQSFDRFVSVLGAYGQTPAMQEALRWAQEELTAPKVEDLDLESPEGVQAIKTTADIARLVPEKIDLAQADVILRQDRERPAPILTPQQRQDIHAAASLAQAVQAYAQVTGSQEDRIEIVNRQIETAGGKSAHQKSLTQHAFDINFAMRNGQEQAARRRMQHLGMFARSMRNKLEAMNQAIQNGDRKRVAYQALGPENRWLPKDGGQSVFYNPGTAASQRLAQQIHADAAAAITLANSFAREYPEYGISEINIPTLVNPADIIKDNSSNNRDTEKRGSSTASKVASESQATTSEIDPDPRQVELPLPNPEPKPEPISTQAVPETQEASNSTDLAAPVQEANDTARPEASVSEVVSPAVASGSRSELQTLPGVSEDTTQKTSEAFPKLVRSGGRNLFHEVFRFPKEQASRLLASANPLFDMFKAIRSPSWLRRATGLTPDNVQLDAVQDLLSLAQQAGKAMDDRLELPKVKSLLELLKKDDPSQPVIRFVRGRALNIVEPAGEGFAYNEQLRQTALLAGIDWLINGQASANMDRENVAAVLGMSDASSEMVEMFNRGLSVDQAKQQLARRIVQFWGLEINRNADMAYAEGIAQAVAIEVLAGFDKVGLIAHVNEDRFQAITGKTYGRIYFDMRDENTNDIFRNISGARTLLAKAALIDPEQAVSGISVGQPIREISKQQLRNPGIQTTRQQRQALSNEQSVRYLPNLPVFDLIEDLGEDAFVHLMSGLSSAQQNPSLLNINHARSVEGKIRGLRMAFRNVQAQMREIEAYAEAQSMPVDQVPTFYKHEITRVGRLQMMGNSNPQSDKLAREIFMPTRSELNLARPQDQDFFWLTVAQGLGIKTEIDSRAVARQKAEDKIAGQYADIVRELKHWVRSRNDGKRLIPTELVQDILRAAGGSITMHGVHSLLSVAQFQVAQEDGADLSRFVHFNYLEADGKTNGPINALMLLSRGAFSLDWLKAVGKGGVFFGSRNQGRTLNQHFQESGAVDLYGEAANAHKIQMATLSETLKAFPEVQAQMGALLRLMSNLNADVGFDPATGAVTIKRGIAKNPLTISIYGSGIDGIAGKVAGELVDFIYQRMSEFIQARSQGSTESFETTTYDNFWADLEALTGSRAVYDKLSGEYQMKDGFKPRIEGRVSNTPEGFTIQAHQFETLKTNIRTLFVNPLATAIDQTVMGHVGATTDAIQRATQIQSIVMRALYRRAIIEKLAERKSTDPDFRDGDFLSERELRGTIRDLLPMGASFSTGTQSYFLGSSEQSDILGNTDESGKKTAIKLKRDGREISISVPEHFARGLADDFTSGALIYGPGLAGVKSVPSLVIGSGDGQMMLNAAINPKIQNVLKVFDGMNMPADQIESYSRAINENVHQTWLQNPVRAVAKSFQDFLGADPFKTVLDESDELNQQTRLMADVLLELTKVATGNPKPKEMISVEEARDLVIDLAQDLKTITAEIDARQKVFATLPMTVDQMASGESPFVQEGAIQDQTLDDAGLVEMMNREMQKALNQEPAEIVREIIETAPVAVPEARVRVVQGKALSWALAKDLEKLDNNRKELLAAAFRALDGAGYRAVFGEASDVDAWLQANNADRYQPGMLDQAHGFVDPVAKILVVTNGTTETLLHELVHAATYSKVAAYYADPNSISDVEQLAVENIEALMNQWLLEDYSDEGELAQTAQHLAMVAIREHLNADRRAAAVNEFMAWVLSNQALARVAAKTRITQTLFQIVGDALTAIRNLIWGKRPKIRAPRAGDDVLSQLRFNTRILMDAQPMAGQALAQDSAAIALYQSASFGRNDRLSELRQRFHDKLTAWASAMDLDRGAADVTAQITRRTAQEKSAFADAAQVANGFIAQDFLKTPQEQTTFMSMLAALAVDVELNPHALTRIQDLYDHVIDELKVEDFLTGQGDAQADRDQAQRKYNALHGLYGEIRDEQGRSSLMPAFLALAMVDEDFRQILHGMKLPKAEKGKDPRSLDDRLTDLGVEGMDRLSRLMSGEGEHRSAPSVQVLLDRLVQSLLENTGDTRTLIEKTTEDGIEKIDSYLGNQLQNLSDKIGDKASAIIKDNPNAGMRAGARIVRTITAFVNQAQAEEAGRGVIQWLNRHDGIHSLRELANDIVGRNRDNASIFDLITRVRSTVQQTRQQFREHLPKTLAEKFSRRLSDAEWSGLFQGLAKTDLASLHSAFGVTGSIDLLTDPGRVTAAIANLERLIRAQDPKRARRLLDKSQQLAHYMLTGEHGSRLLRNAYAVARLVGEGGHSLPTVDEALVENIERLVTLYALRDLDQGSKDILSALAQDEVGGMAFVLSYLRGLRNTEQDKGTHPVARLNAYKGYVPSDTEQGVSLIVASDSEHARLIGLGYSRLGAYQGSSADRNLGRRSYYFAPVSGRAAYNQGVMQTVHLTMNGIDPNTGFTVGELTAGRITDPQIVGLINRQLANQRQTSENLLPVYDANGNIAAFERAFDPTQIQRLNHDRNLSRMMGVWAGRQVEEQLAVEFNKLLVERLHETWTEGKRALRRDEFVNLANLKKSDDPVLHEAWRLVPQHTREAIQEIFGKDGFQVRRDMLNDAIGYRSASVGDLFTGNTRWKPGVQKAFQDIALSLFGNKAYLRLVQGERLGQDLVTNAKVLIVVKSVVVPAANLMSNVFQLLNRGVPVRNIVRGLGAKTAELNDFIKRRHQEIDLEAELQAVRGINDLTQIRKLESRIQTLKDSYRRLSIWPLIEAGEFSAISNGVVTAEDLALAEGKWGEWAEKLSARVPERFRTLFRYGFITRDTALFQGLGKAVQYGDFLGKAILYEDLTRRKKLDKKEAIAHVNEAFVNYNRLSGRSRQYLESVGLLWFYNFKLRSIKEAAYMLRHHPLRSIFLMGMAPKLPGLGSIGSPVTDNFLGILADGKLDYSIGPGMGLNSFSLNPWVNLVR